MAKGCEVLAYLGKTEDGCDILKCDNSIEPYRLVRGYDPEEVPGQQWSHTVTACRNINELAEAIIHHDNPVSYWRACELATQLISNAVENDTLRDLLYDGEIELDDDERIYFGVPEFEDLEE